MSTLQQAAGLPRRLGSLCYETVLLAAILFAGGWIFLPVSGLLPHAIARPLFQLYLAVLAAAYFVVCWTKAGQTLPMKTWGIKLVTANGGNITLRAALRRYLFAVLSVGFCGAGFLWTLIDRDRQFLHDRLAGTKIIRDASARDRK